MPRTTLEEFDLTVSKVLSRNPIDNEEEVKWRVDADNVSRPCVGDTPEEALDVFTSCLTTDNEEVKIDIEDLTEATA